MPFVHRDALEPLKRNPFIGRTKELQFFKQSILEPKFPSHNIISIYGPGGVGKSTLLSQMIMTTQEPGYNDYCYTALVDKGDVDPILIMDKFATQLQIKGKFRKQLDRYTELLQKHQSEQEDAQYKTLQKSVGVASDLIKDIPAPIINTVASRGTEILGDLLINKLSHHHYRNDLKVLSNPLADITKYFIQELNRIADAPQMHIFKRNKRDNRIILFFDGFEKIYTSVSQWLVNEFLTAKISSNVILVFSSRDSIDRLGRNDSSWLSLFQDNNTYFMPIHTFTRSETEQFLSSRGIIRAEALDTLWQLSKGLPLYLGIITTNPNKILDPTIDVIANILDELPEETDVRRKLAVDAALLGLPFTQDDFHIFNYIERHEIEKNFYWLTMQSFIHSNPVTGRYTYHDAIQDIFCRHKLQTTPGEYRQARQKIVDHYYALLKTWHTERSAQGIDPYYIELVIAIATQHFHIGDNINLSQAVEILILSYERVRLSNPFISFLESIIQHRGYNGLKEEAQYIATCILEYLHVSIGKDILQVSISNLLKLLDLEISSQGRSQIYALLGQVYFVSKREKEALIYYDQAISLNHKEANLYIKRSYIYRKQNKLKEALSDVNSAIQINPLVSYYYTRQSIYSDLGFFKEALEDLNYLIQIEPSDASNYFFRAVTYMDIKSYQEALVDANNAISINPVNADYFHTRGHILNALNRAKAALSDFNEAIKIKPDVAAHYFCRADIYRLLGQHQKALSDCDLAIQLNPREPDHYVAKASIYEELHEEYKAIDEVNKAIALDPNQATFLHKKAHIYMNLNCLSEAVAEFEQAIELAPNAATHYHCLSEVYRKLGQYEIALSKSYSAIELEPDSSEYHRQRAHIYENMKDWQNALANYDQAITLNPTNSTYYGERALIYVTLQDFSKALADINLAIECQADEAELYNRRSFIYFCLREYKQALSDSNIAIKIDNTNASYYNMRGIIYAEIGQIKQAFADYDRALQIDPTDDAAKSNKRNLNKKSGKKLGKKRKQ